MKAASVAVPRVLAVSPGTLDPSRPDDAASLDRWLAGLATDGVDGAWIREKSLDDRTLATLARDAVVARDRGQAPRCLLLGGRADIALVAGLDGVHLPTIEMPARLLRPRLGPQALIGRSTHHPDEVAAAADDGADYVTFGPVFATPSKAAFGPPPGLRGLERAARVGLPVLALGGMTDANLQQAADAGAAGVAAQRALADPDARRALVTAAKRAWSVADSR